MQQIISLKDAREVELLSQIQTMQAQLGHAAQGSSSNFFDPSQFQSDNFVNGNELQSIGDYAAQFGSIDGDGDHQDGDIERGRARGRRAESEGMGWEA